MCRRALMLGMRLAMAGLLITLTTVRKRSGATR
jgi:hypothetical protein